MYVLQEKPDDMAMLQSGEIVTPVATLKDEFGGISHVVTDDHCYVLVNGSNERGFVYSYHWYREAVAVLRTLPMPE